MAFPGTDIARGGVDGPYRVHARVSIGGLPYMTNRPIADWGGPVVEWNYTTKTYAASQFERPMRPATFTGDHSDSAVDLDGDGLADFLELRADVHVNLAGHYALNGYLSKGAGTDVVRLIAYGYRDLDLATTDTSVVLRFRGDQIRQAGVDGPWDFSLTLYDAPLAYAGGNMTPGPIGTILPPLPTYYPETLCGTTSAYRSADFDDTIELVRYTGRFEEMTPIATGTAPTTPSSSGRRSRCSPRPASTCPGSSPVPLARRSSRSRTARRGCQRASGGRNSPSRAPTSGRPGSTVRTWPRSR